MKRKSLLALFCAAALALSLTACGSGSTDNTTENENTEGDSSDAEEVSEGVTIGTAYLDCYLKGDVDAYAELTGQSAEDLSSTFATSMEQVAAESVGGNADAPGSALVSTDVLQTTIDLWTQVYGAFDYTVTAAEESDTGYTLTIETRKMKLYEAESPIFAEKMEAYYASAEEESSDEDSTDETDESVDTAEAGTETEEELTSSDASLTDSTAELPSDESSDETSDTVDENVDALSAAIAENTSEALQEAFASVTYADETETLTVELVKEDDAYAISNDELNALKAALLDTDYDGSTGEDPENLGEGAPNTEYPDDLDTTDDYAVGTTVDLTQDGETKATLTIDSVEVTDERADYNETNPDKVVIITYTYQNLSADDAILYDQMSFRLLDGETVCDPYYLESLISPELAQPGGEPVTASIAYGVSADCTEAVIYVSGYQLDYTFQETIQIP